jgi:hypothetical protein
LVPEALVLLALEVELAAHLQSVEVVQRYYLHKVHNRILEAQQLTELAQ